MRDRFSIEVIFNEDHLVPMDIKESAKLNKEDILTRIIDNLTEIGFRRLNKSYATLDTGPGFVSWMGVVDSRIDRESFEIYINVGVHAELLERMWTSLGARERVKYNRRVATHASPISLVDRSCSNRNVIDTFNIDKKCKDLSFQISTTGIDFARKISSYEALSEKFYQNINRLGANPERYACCLLLMGHTVEAKRFATAFVETEPEYFTEFYKNFMRDELTEPFLIAHRQNERRPRR